MRQLESFITSKYRPEITGSKLDQSHKTRFYYSNEPHQSCQDIMQVNAICIGPKQDYVLYELEHNIAENDNILIFYYEDMHKRWSFIVNNNEEFFIYRKNSHEQYFVKAKNLYVRGCYVDETSKYWTLIGNFLNLTDIWRGNVLCARKSQVYNESKLFQLCNSLKKSLNKTKQISIGRSYIIKSKNHEKFLDNNNKYIVKSLSAIRSQVVDGNDYKHWNLDAIKNLPVLFQERVDGKDMRVHIVDDVLYIKLSLAKNKVDYRYSDGFLKLVDVDTIPEGMQDFCEKVAAYENNRLMGIDFLQTNDGYIVLEANPSPGWASYYSYKGIMPGSFVLDILRILKSD
jgi:hypothetical protein